MGCYYIYQWKHSWGLRLSVLRHDTPKPSSSSEDRHGHESGKNLRFSTLRRRRLGIWRHLSCLSGWIPVNRFRMAGSSVICLVINSSSFLFHSSEGVSNQHSSKLSVLIQLQFYYAHGFCGLEIQKGQRALLCFAVLKCLNHLQVS